MACSNLVLQSGMAITLPTHPIARSEFCNMADEGREWREFLITAHGCSRFVDLGASGGFFSALFSITRNGRPSKVLSVDFDKASLHVLRQVRFLNRKQHIEWIIDERGVSDTYCPVRILSTGYGAAISENWSRELTNAAAKANGCPVEEFVADFTTLEALCLDYEFVPDLLKIDVEGYEYEVLMSSYNLLRYVKPNIYLELHIDFLQRRQKCYHQLIHLLEHAGYRLISGMSLSGFSPTGTVRFGMTAR